jgi:hypothetical protein
MTRGRAIAAGLALAALSGCGGGKATSTAGTSTSTSTTAAAGTRCQAVARPRIAAGGLRSTALMKPFELSLRRLSSVHTKVRVRVTGSRMLGAVPAYFTKRERRFEAAGGRFLAVRYTVTNVGARATESASTINNLFNVAGTGTGPSYGRADVAAACTTVSPSVAKQFHVASPETKLAPGDHYATVAVYVVPRGLGALRWASVGARREVQLGRGT